MKLLDLIISRNFQQACFFSVFQKFSALPSILSDLANETTVEDLETKADTPPTLLIVDDVPENIKVLGEALMKGYQILVARNGEQALKTARTQHVDMVLLDIVMPGMDGYEVCRKLKSDELTRDIPVIFITTLDATEDETAGLELGAVDYITKPFRFPIIKARVKTHLELKAKNDLLVRLANIDGLTGVPNRRCFDVTLEKEWRRGQRSKEELSLVLMDVDCFKKYNDHYGHVAGDFCLRSVAQAVAESAGRAGDLVARYGGGEFAVILPGTDAQGAVEVARKVQQAVRALGLEHKHSTATDIVTLSIGVASIVPTSDVRPEMLIESADRSLYGAKEAGRDRVGAPLAAV